MSGVPFWGKETFSDIRQLTQDSFPVVSLKDFSALACSRGYYADITDMYHLFEALSLQDYLIAFPNTLSTLSSDPEVLKYLPPFFVTWSRDVRFNYRDRLVFIPVYYYDIALTIRQIPDESSVVLDVVDSWMEEGSSKRFGKIAVKHSFIYHQHVIDDRDTGFREEYLLLYNPTTKHKCKLYIKDLPYFSDATFSLTQLYERYINAAYIYSENFDFDWTKYLRIKNTKAPNEEQKLRKSLKFPDYANPFKDIGYKDVRQYPFEVLYGRPMRLDSDQPYWRRILEFEAYLYCAFAQGVPPEETDWVRPFNELGKSKRTLSFGDSYPLILKYYYKNNPSLRKKTYERFYSRK